MNKKTERELENQDNWDYEHLEARGPARAPRVVVSVAFRREDFEKLSEYAERAGKKISEFIREAALEKVTGSGMPNVNTSVDAAGVLWLGGYPPGNTQVDERLIIRKTPESAITCA